MQKRSKQRFSVKSKGSHNKSFKRTPLTRRRLTPALSYLGSWGLKNRQLVLGFAQFAATVGAFGKIGSAKLFLLAPCRLKAAGLCVPGAGSVVRFQFTAGSFGCCGFSAFVHVVGLVILAALVTLGAGQPLSVGWCSAGFWSVRS